MCMSGENIINAPLPIHDLLAVHDSLTVHNLLISPAVRYIQLAQEDKKFIFLHTAHGKFYEKS